MNSRGVYLLPPPPPAAVIPPTCSTDLPWIASLTARPVVFDHLGAFWGDPNMRIAAYTVFYDTKRMSELGRGSPTLLQNPPEGALKATIAFLLLRHRLWTLQNGPLGVSSGLMGVPRATSGDFWTPLGALLGSLGHSWGPVWRPKNPQISRKLMKKSKNGCLPGIF